MRVWVESDCVPLKEAEMIHNTGKIAKKIRSNAMINLTVTLNCFWNFLDVRNLS